jgi:hypothetical protein
MIISFILWTKSGHADFYVHKNLYMHASNRAWTQQIWYHHQNLLVLWYLQICEYFFYRWHFISISLPKKAFINARFRKIRSLLRGIKFTQVQHYWGSTLQIAFSHKNGTMFGVNTCFALPNAGRRSVRALSYCYWQQECTETMV